MIIVISVFISVKSPETDKRLLWTVMSPVRIQLRIFVATLSSLTFIIFITIFCVYMFLNPNHSSCSVYIFTTIKYSSNNTQFLFHHSTFITCMLDNPVSFLQRVNVYCVNTRVHNHIKAAVKQRVHAGRG